MKGDIEKYTRKLIRDRSAIPDTIRFYRLDDVVITQKEDDWLPVFNEVFTGLNVTALLFARPSLPFTDLLVQRTEPGADRITPTDSETRTFLHDISLIRRQEWTGLPKSKLAPKIIRCLRERKAVVIEGLGAVATGGVTIEQAYIAYSTIFHTTFVKYLLDILTEGFRLPKEHEAVEDFKKTWDRPQNLGEAWFTPGPLEMNSGGGRREEAKDVIYREICRVGRYTVEKGLVDSFFGNISYFDGSTIYISQTASSLDDLEGHIDPVPIDGSSTAGLSASSELPAHKAIYLSSNYHAVLHGHPKFSVILSMLCNEKGCDIKDCARLCNRRRSVCGVQVVAGEIGAGGLAKTVPAAMKETGACIVYGHGAFTAGERDFRDAFMKMMDIENRCREEYFDLLKERIEL